MVEMITSRNLINHELIGLNVSVIDSTNKSQVGIKGKVIYETKNMMIIETECGEKKIQKKKNVFVFTLPDQTKVKVNGEILIKKPEERIKIKLKKW